MSSWIWSLLFIVSLGALAYWRVPLLLAATLTTGYALLSTVAAHPGFFPLLLSWLAAAVLLGLAIAPLRRALISDRVLPVLRRALPAMSQTERDALEAGTVWWDAELFSGRPDWNKLLAIPVPRLSQDEQDFLDGPVEQLCRMLDDWKITQEEFDLPPEVWAYIKAQGFFLSLIHI